MRCDISRRHDQVNYYLYLQNRIINDGDNRILIYSIVFVGNKEYNIITVPCFIYFRGETR